MTQPNRIDGGVVDRSTELTFSFNGRSFHGYGGDTLASALLANGQRLVGRSFKYHRPRGIVTAGAEEPSALVTLLRDGEPDPNTRATVVELRDGLEAHSQNHRGPLGFDLMAVTDFLPPVLGAGFYYKTFMWPAAFWEKVYEPLIRSSAGLGRLSGNPDPDRAERGFLHCDLLVIGAGPAGLAAALAAGRAGARVILADEDFLPGGRLNAETHEIDGMPGAAWARQAAGELSALDNVRVLTRTTVFGAFDHGVYGALERTGDGAQATDKTPRHLLWRIYSRQALLCAGATERPIAFHNNDRPGVMLAGAVRAYVNRWGVAPGRRVAVFTNNDDGWRTATDLAAKGVQVAAIVDARSETGQSPPPDVPAVQGAAVTSTRGRRGVRAVQLSDGEWLQADCVAVSGGWTANLHLSCHHGSRPGWDADRITFLPGRDLPPGMRVAGAANGAMTLAEVLRQGHAAANAALKDLGLPEATVAVPRADDEPSAGAAFWHVSGNTSRAFVDLQNDVTVKDLLLAVQEGYSSVEHAKRYTTLGMGTDQGKTASVPAIAILAAHRGVPMDQVGTTVFRPPYTPVPVAAFAGRSRGKAFRPVRLTPSHQWAAERGAVFIETGHWLRAQWFPQAGESHWRESVDREVRTTRAAGGVCDVTTLGKVEVRGRDAATFLNRVYANGFAKLPVGKTRYGLMLREDGMAFDDGTTARLAEEHFVMTTTTANDAAVFRHLEFCRQCLWPMLDVHLVSVTEQWAQFAVAGPRSRDLLRKVVDEGVDLSNDAFPFMACRELTVCNGTAARLFRISFSGELAYEIAVPARYGDSLVRVLMAAGEEFGVTPYGTEALGVMRIEKGHAAGPELNGQTTARDLGMGRMVSPNKDSIGNVLSRRPALDREDGLALMGFIPVDPAETFAAGAHFLPEGVPARIENDEGWMSSAAFSPNLGHTIGLGFIRRGDRRVDEVVRAVDPVRGRDTRVRIVSPHFVDPEGERLRV